MRVLMTTKAGAGHFGPLIPFARAFQRAGADVLVAAPREAASMVRAERLPLWAFDDPPARERAAIFADVRDQPADAGQHGRVAGDIFARIDARAAFPGVLAACRAWGPDLVISEITEFAGPLAAEVIGVPSVAVGISQQGKEERVRSVGRRRASRSCAARSAWRPTRAASACCAGRTSRSCPPRSRIPPPRRVGRAHRFREPRGGVRRHPRLRRARWMGARSSTSPSARRRRAWTSSRACTAPPSTRSPACPCGCW